MLHHRWQKSSFSAHGDACLYLAPLSSEAIGLHESNCPDVILTPTPDKIRRLISRIRFGFVTRP
ncbi:DUF397 domain-containing protein [Streptomyces griseocarneus]|nr:DUF397 domain-containing protein [Streptomyces griseocarneus]